MRTLTNLIAFVLVAWITAEVVTYAYRQGVRDGAEGILTELEARPRLALKLVMSQLLDGSTVEHDDQAEANARAFIDGMWEGATR